MVEFFKEIFFVVGYYMLLMTVMIYRYREYFLCFRLCVKYFLDFVGFAVDIEGFIFII